MRGEHWLRYSMVSIYRNRHADHVFILRLQNENSLKFRGLVSRVRRTSNRHGRPARIYVLSKFSRCRETTTVHLQRGRGHDRESAGVAWYDQKEEEATLPDKPEAEKAKHWKECED